MFNLLRSPFKFITTSRIHVVVLYFLSTLLFVSNFNEVTSALLISIFCFTILCAGVYLGNRYTDNLADATNEPENFFVGKLTLIISVLCVLIPVILLYICRLPVVPYILFAPVSLLYSHSIFGIRFKDYWYIKNIFAASMWYFSWVVLVFFYGEGDFTLNSIFASSWPWFFLVMMYEIIWDMRDMKGDKLVGTSTIPLVFGLRIAKYVASVELLVFFFVMYQTTIYKLFLLGYLPLLVGVYFIKKTIKPIYFHFFIYYQITLVIIALYL